MSNKDTSGPAFPVPMLDGERWNGPGNCCGMTLRDWFAGQVLSGIASDPEFNNMSYDMTARIAFLQADAMLEVRNSTTEKEESQ
jgi:hypothetical protein